MKLSINLLMFAPATLVGLALLGCGHEPVPADETTKQRAMELQRQANSIEKANRSAAQSNELTKTQVENQAVEQPTEPPTAVEKPLSEEERWIKKHDWEIQQEELLVYTERRKKEPEKTYSHEDIRTEAIARIKFREQEVREEAWKQATGTEFPSD